MRPGVEGCGVVVWFGKHTDIAFLVSLFGFTQVLVQPILARVKFCLHSLLTHERC